MNRCIRGPYVQWCERRTSSLTSGEAAYSITGMGFRVYLPVNVFNKGFL